MTAAQNDKSPITILVVQPVDQKVFLTESYASLSQKSLDAGVNRFILLQEDRSYTQTFNIELDDSPAAIYFIMKRQPVSSWKYLVDKPQGEDLTFQLNGYNVKKVD